MARYTIVVADDEEELRKAILRNLNWEELGFTVVGEAENGIEALALVEEKEPDLLLTDIRMPFITGLELARQVREVRPSTQIAFLSGYDDFAYAQEAIRYNIISYLLKPISMEELRENLLQIRQKLDRIFSEFSGTQNGAAGLSEFLLPLLLTPASSEKGETPQDPEREERLQREAVSRHFLGPENCNIHYVALSLFAKDGAGTNRTQYEYAHAVDGILKKYLKAATFYLEDHITAVLAATPASFDKYLHIATEELEQSIGRILGLSACIGLGRPTEFLSALSESYGDSISAMRHAAESASGGICYIGDLMEEQKQKNSMDICDHALHLIEERFAEPGLSLVFVSSLVGVSPNYLSAKIKKKTGKNFIDCLTERRMKAAKKLLLNTPMKVREIAEACGYSDQHYFSYCFKKYEGKSPNQLRAASETAGASHMEADAAGSGEHTALMRDRMPRNEAGAAGGV